MEDMRLAKDARIAELEDAFERYRIDTTKTINSQNIQIKTLTQTVLKHESTIITLNEIITKKEDVEKQLDDAANHINELFSQKENL